MNECQVCRKRLGRFEIHNISHCAETLGLRAAELERERDALKSALAEQETVNNRITAANIALRAELEIVRRQWKDTINRRWIPTTEKMPNNGVSVLFYVPATDIVYCGRYYRVCDRWVTDEVALYGVSYWMPLPEAPL